MAPSAADPPTVPTVPPDPQANPVVEAETGLDYEDYLRSLYAGGGEGEQPSGLTDLERSQAMLSAASKLLTTPGDFGTAVGEALGGVVPALAAAEERQFRSQQQDNRNRLAAALGLSRSDVDRERLGISREELKLQREQYARGDHNARERIGSELVNKLYKVNIDSEEAMGTTVKDGIPETPQDRAWRKSVSQANSFLHVPLEGANVRRDPWGMPGGKRGGLVRGVL